jgi:predicted nucleotidyltransferase
MANRALPVVVQFDWIRDVYLGGSYAYGKPKKTSDVDLLVVMYDGIVDYEDETTHDYRIPLERELTDQGFCVDHTQPLGLQIIVQKLSDLADAKEGTFEWDAVRKGIHIFSREELTLERQL